MPHFLAHMSSPSLSDYEFDAPRPTINQHLELKYEEYTPFRFANVDAWPEIHDIVDSNSKGLDQLSIPYETDANILINLIAEQLHVNCQTKKLEKLSITHFMDQDAPQKALMVGVHYNEEYYRLDDNSTLHEVMIRPPEQLDSELKSYFDAIQALLSTMLIHDILFGYIASPDKMRMFSISDPKDGSNQLNLNVSPAIVSSERYRILLGMALHVHHKSPFLCNELGMFVEAIQTTDPPMWIHKLSHPIPAPSKDWKKDSYMRRRIYKLCCHWQLGPKHPLPEFLYGVLRTDVQNGTSSNSITRAYSPVVLKYASNMDVAASKALNNEAMMYEYLMSRQCASVPTRLLYANLMDSIHVLCLEPFGQQLTPEDLPKYTPQVRSALRALHQRGIAHGDIKLECFFRRQDKVIISNFSKSRLFKRVPPEIVAVETKQVERLCAFSSGRAVSNQAM